MTPPIEKITANTVEETFRRGAEIGAQLRGGELVLLTGGLGAGKTVLTKGILSALGYDPNEVTSPSFTFVNLYKADLDVYHIDLWRLETKADAAAAVGLDDILTDEKAVVIIEWAEKLDRPDLVADAIKIEISGDGDEPRVIMISLPKRSFGIGSE